MEPTFISQFLNWLQRLTGIPSQAIVALAIGLLVAGVYFKIIFGGFGGFTEDVQNDTRSVLDPEYDRGESGWSHVKIMAWLLLSVGSAFLAYEQLPGWFPSLFS